MAREREELRRQQEQLRYEQEKRNNLKRGREVEHGYLHLVLVPQQFCGVIINKMMIDHETKLNSSDYTLHRKVNREEAP